eukprot:5685050-Amphidinium_carterae.2
MLQGHTFVGIALNFVKWISLSAVLRGLVFDECYWSYGTASNYSDQTSLSKRALSFCANLTAGLLAGTPVQPVPNAFEGFIAVGAPWAANKCNMRRCKASCAIVCDSARSPRGKLCYGSCHGCAGDERPFAADSAGSWVEQLYPAGSRDLKPFARVAISGARGIIIPPIPVGAGQQLRLDDAQQDIYDETWVSSNRKHATARLKD